MSSHVTQTPPDTSPLEDRRRAGPSERRRAGSPSAAPTPNASEPAPALRARGRGHWFDPTNAMAWLFVALLAVGVVACFTHLVRPGLVVSAPGVVFSVVFWTLFAVPWLVFISHRELFARLTRRTAVLGFLWGGFVATFVIAMTAEIPFMDTLAQLTDPGFVARWGAGLTAGWIEEIACGLGIVAVLAMLRQRLRSPFEMMVLGMFVGFGFQVVEDLEYMVQGLSTNFGEDVIDTLVESFVGRVVVASWWSHQLFTGLFGAGLGYLMSRDAPRKPAVAVGLMASAIVLHSFWDSPLLDVTGNPLVYGPLKGAILLGFFIWVWRRAVTAERNWVVEELGAEVTAGTITSEDLDALAASYHRRRRRWHHISKEFGHDAATAERTFQSSVITLADELVDADAAEADAGTSPGVAAARAEVIRLRGLRDSALQGSAPTQ